MIETNVSICRDDDEVDVVVFVFNVPTTAKVIWKRGHSLKSHPTDLCSRGSKLRPLVYKASGLSTKPQRLHKVGVSFNRSNNFQRPTLDKW